MDRQAKACVGSRYMGACTYIYLRLTGPPEKVLRGKSVSCMVNMGLLTSLVMADF